MTRWNPPTPTRPVRSRCTRRIRIGGHDLGRMDEPAASILGQVPVYPILLSTDLAESRAFYGDRLGLPLLNERTERLVGKLGLALDMAPEA